MCTFCIKNLHFAKIAFCEFTPKIFIQNVQNIRFSMCRYNCVIHGQLVIMGSIVCNIVIVTMIVTLANVFHFNMTSVFVWWEWEQVTCVKVCKMHESVEVGQG